MSSIKNGKIYGGKHNPKEGLSIVGLSDRERDIAANEGFVPTVYKDTEGYDTIGIGHKLTKEEINSGKINGKPIEDLDHQDLIKLYRQDIGKHDKDTDRLVKSKGIDINSLPQDAQDVLREMGYNMGSKSLGKFNKMFKALKVGDYKEAQRQALDSKWANQVKGRATKLAAKLGDADKAEITVPDTEKETDFLNTVAEPTPKETKPEKYETIYETEDMADVPSIGGSSIFPDATWDDKELDMSIDPTVYSETETSEEPELFEEEEEAIIPSVQVEHKPKKVEGISPKPDTSDELESDINDELEPESELMDEEIEVDIAKDEALDREEKLFDEEFNSEKARTVGDETNKLLRPSVKKIAAGKLVEDKLDKDLPGIDYLVDSNLIPEEMWKDKSKSLDDIAGVMNESIRSKRAAIMDQFKKDKDESQKDKWIIGLALAAQVFANGMQARALHIPDQIVNGRLVRGRRAGTPRQVDFSILKDIDKDIKDKRDYRMKRAGLTLADAKFRFKIRKDARDLGLREQKDESKQSEKMRLEGKKDAKDLEKKVDKERDSANKEIKKKHEKVLTDIQRTKPKKFEEAVKNSLIANLKMEPEDAENFMQERNWLGELFNSDMFGLGLSEKEADTLLTDITKKMESEVKDKPEAEASSDNLYDPKIHKLKKNQITGETWIWTKDGNEKVAEYGKQ